ncbi:unnamed protein product [Prunus armeniaca]
MGIGKYREYRQNIGDIALIGDISSISEKIWPYPPISVSTVQNIDISDGVDSSKYRYIGRYIGVSADISILGHHSPKFSNHSSLERILGWESI